MEAIILAGGRAERLGDAAGGKPKSLVLVGGPPACGVPGDSAGRRRRRPRDRQLCRGCRCGVRAGAGRSRPGADGRRGARAAGRGGGLRYAASARREQGDVYALNGDELLALDLAGAPRQAPRGRRGGHHHRHPATVLVRRRRAGRGRPGHGIRRGTPVSRTGSAAACTCSAPRPWLALPERGDHETSTFPSARRGGTARRVPLRGHLDHRQHAEGPPHVRRNTLPPNPHWLAA